MIPEFNLYEFFVLDVIVNTVISLLLSLLFPPCFTKPKFKVHFYYNCLVSHLFKIHGQATKYHHQLIAKPPNGLHWHDCSPAMSPKCLHYHCWAPKDLSLFPPPTSLAPRVSLSPVIPCLHPEVNLSARLAMMWLAMMSLRMKAVF